MNNNIPFYNLIHYNNISIDNINENNCIQYLNNILNYSDILNDSLNPLIDYEKLIFLEIKFNNHPEIQNLLKQIKFRINNNYIYKQKYLIRIFPKENI